MNAHLIAIVGGSGSGKTWLAQRLLTEFGGQAGRVSLDDFYRDLSPLPPARRNKVNFDDPEAIDWALFKQTISRLRDGESVLLPEYDYSTHTRRAQTMLWSPRPLVLLDGLWLLRDADLREQYSLSVFVDCPESLRLARRIERDQRERGRSAASIRAQFHRHVAPMHELYVAPQIQNADIVVKAGNSYSHADLCALIGRLLARKDVL